ncbi:MAG: hypothetical protein ACE5GW_12275, partial [Planctomycetota bacterium]
MRDKWEAYIWLIILVGLPLIRWLAVLLGKLIQGGQPPRPSPLARDLRPTPGRRPTPPRRPPMMLVEEDEEDGQVMAQAQRAAD